MTQRKRRTPHLPHHEAKRKEQERVRLNRTDWICIGVAGAILMAMLPAFFVSGAGKALLYYCLPVSSVLELAKPSSESLPAVAPAPEPLLMAELMVEEPPAQPVSAIKTATVPRILIYHTHATEAYFPTASDSYEASGTWRTNDATKSVVAVGARLAELLQKEYGLGVIHDKSNYEPPKLSSAYSRSLAAMENYKKQYPTLEIFIDVHRDAYGIDSVAEPKDFVELDNKQVARLMFVVGTGEGATGTGFDERPDFESNLALAQAITNRLQTKEKQLTRDVRIKTGRYNQHVSSACLLVEVGHNANTLSQALNAVPYLAAAIAECVPGAETPKKLTAMSVWTP